MADVGTVKLRQTNGKASLVEVSTTSTGAVDIVFRRTSEGEALVRLPSFAARELADLLIKATAKTAK